MVHIGLKMYLLLLNHLHIQISYLFGYNHQLILLSCDACPSACEDQTGCRGGSTTSCYDYSGAGGGGSGGSLYLRGQVVNVGGYQFFYMFCCKIRLLLICGLVNLQC